MGRSSKSEPSSRLNLELSVSARESLEKLRALTKADSLSEVIRRSLQVYGRLIEEKEKGNALLVRNNKQDKEILLP